MKAHADSPDSSGLDHLAQALAVWQRYCAGAEGSREQLLERHAELRDLLLALLDGAIAEEGSIATAATDPNIGKVLANDFRLLQPIGSGGMGRVFIARQLSLDRAVAVKLLATHALHSAKSMARFKREAQTLARLKHRNIVEIHAVGEDHGEHWFAMELVAGQTLDRYASQLRSEDQDGYVQRIVRLVAQVADALAYAHREGIVHRDVKPANVLVRADGTPVLTDFGLAREDNLPGLTLTGEFVGTPYYVAPEQVTASAYADARSDVFSLGVTLYELLTQQMPFRGTTTQAVLQQILNQDPPSPEKLNQAISRDLAAIVMKALEKKPAHRYGSAEDLAQDLRNLLAFRPVVAKPLGSVQRLRRWLHREPWQAGLVGLLAVGLPALLAMWLVLRTQQHDAEIGRQKTLRDRVDELLIDSVASRMDGDFKRERRLIYEATRLMPDDPLAVGMEVILHTGWLASGKMMNPTMALSVLDRHRPAGGVHPALQRLRAHVLQELGREAEGKAILDSLGEPRDALEWYVTGYKMRLVGAAAAQDQSEATQAFLRAVLTSPRNIALFHHELTSAASFAGQNEVALAAAESMTQLWPDKAISWIALANYWIEMDRKRARLAVKRVLEISPNSVWGHLLLGQIIFNNGNAAAALPHLERAYQLDADCLPARVLLGRTLLVLGEFQRALEMLESAIRYSPPNVILLCEKGEALIGLDRKAEAAEWLRIVETRFPDEPGVKELLARCK